MEFSLVICAGDVFEVLSAPSLIWLSKIDGATVDTGTEPDSSALMCLAIKISGNFSV